MRRPRPASTAPGKKLRLDRILTFALIGLILVDGFMLLRYRNALARQTSLNKQVVTVTRTLQQQKETSDIAVLRQKLARAEKEALEAAPWRRSHLWVDIDNLVAEAAGRNSVEVTSLQNVRGTVQKVGGGEYVVEKLQVRARGVLAQIISFLGQVEAGSYPTLRLDNITFASAKESWEVSLEVVLLSSRPE